MNRHTRLLLKKISRAFYTFNMVDDGDRIAVAISGGNDSLSLLRLLQIRQSIMRENFELVAIHILGGMDGPSTTGHKPLLEWLEASGVECIIKPMIVADDEKFPMDCYRCAWNRRSTLFRYTNRSECNKLAFGHHFDDMVETGLMNLLYQGRMASMEPCASYFKGKFHLIRPLVYATKKEIDKFAQSNEFPEPPPECPRSSKSKRKVIAEILDLADHSYQNMRWNIFRAAMRCMELEEKARTEDAENNELLISAETKEYKE